MPRSAELSTAVGVASVNGVAGGRPCVFDRSGDTHGVGSEFAHGPAGARRRPFDTLDGIVRRRG